MEEEEVLKLKSSPLLVIMRLLSVLLTIGAIAFLFLGLVDVRTEEQKTAAARKEVKSTIAFIPSVNAVKNAVKNQQLDIVTIKKVSCLKDLSYVLILYVDSNGMWNEATYSTKHEKSYFGGDLYQQTLGTQKSLDLYFGKKNQTYEFKYEGDELKILLEEAGVWL